jgi:uncharacterized glyoxalase superfamily protein PhnB
MGLPLPDGMHNVNPYLVVADPAILMQFVTATFAAREVDRHEANGQIMHAEMRIGDSLLMIGGSTEHAAPGLLYVYVDDCDAAYARALAAGGESIAPPTDMFYGDRHGGVRDTQGNSWWIATHVEDVSPDELARRHDAEMKKRAAQAASA